MDVAFWVLVGAGLLCFLIAGLIAATQAFYYVSEQWLKRIALMGVLLIVAALFIRFLLNALDHLL